MTTVSVDRIQGLSGSIALKRPVACATTGPIPLNGLQTIDGFVLVSGDRVLVKNQITASENGIYEADTSDWRRTLDFNGPGDIAEGTLINVIGGDTNFGLWLLGTVSPAIGTSALMFERPVGYTGAEAINYVPAGPSVVATTVQDQLRYHDSLFVSVTDPAFGAVADGVDTGTAFTGTDNTAAFQAALDYCAANRKELIIPAGNYRLAPASTSSATATLSLTGDWYKISGSGTLLMDENFATSTSGLSYLLGNTSLVSTTTTTNKTLYELFEISGITFKGRWSHGASRNGLRGISIAGFSKILVDNCSFYDVRNKAAQGSFNESFTITKSYARRCARGAFRMQETDRIVATGNTIIEGSDDCLDFHSSDGVGGNFPARSGIIVTDNYLEKTEGITCLGAKLIVVANNTIKLPQGGPIAVGSAITPEGGTSPIGVLVVNNTIIDPIEAMVEGASTLPTSVAGQGAIYVAGVPANGLTSANTVIPGQYNSTTGAFSYPFDSSGTTPSWGAMHTGAIATLSTARGYNYVIANNSILRTLPDVTNYSDYGMGDYYSGTDGYQDPAVSSANYRSNGIVLLGSMENFICSNNTISGLPNAGLYFRSSTSEEPKTAFRNGIVSGNVFTNLNYGVAKDSVGSGVAYADYQDWTINISNNTFDIDPYHKATIRTLPLDGTWASSTALTYIGIMMRNCKNLVIRNNDFSNCYRAVQLNDSSSAETTDTNCLLADNVVRCDPVSVLYDAGNGGVAVPGRGGLFTHLIIDSDPTSATYGKLMNTPSAQASSVPTSGTYVTGHFVKNSNPTTASSKTTLGWVRQTVGSGHTVATTTTADWAPIVATTS